jgi:hypothetical protein
MKVIDEAVREYLSSMKIPRCVRELIKKARCYLLGKELAPYV